MLEAMLFYIIDYLTTNWLDLMWKLLTGLLVFFVLRYISKKIVASIEAKMEKRSEQSSAYAVKSANVIGSVVFIILMMLSALVVFQVIWFDVALIMWWVSMWIWFAMETTITNMVAGVMLLSNKKIKIWDLVNFFWKLKFMWTIDEINIRYTVVKTFDKRRVVIPNSVMAKTPMQTMKSEPLARWEIVFTVPRNVIIDQVKDIMVKAINEDDHVSNKDYTSFFVSWFDARGIQVKTYFFVDQTKKQSAFIVARNIKNNIMATFKEYWISVPYEKYTLEVGE